MNIILREITDSRHVMAPWVEKKQNRQLLRVSASGCTHFLLFRSPLGGAVDLTDPEVQQVLAGLGDPREFREKQIPELGTWLTCVSLQKYRSGGEMLVLREEPACYAVCGCTYVPLEDAMYLYLPARGTDYQTSAAMELAVEIRRLTERQKQGLFRSAEVPSGFWRVRIEKKGTCGDGAVCYRVPDRPETFPVTEEMLGVPFLVKSEGGAPQFFSAAEGLTLKPV